MAQKFKSVLLAVIFATVFISSNARIFAQYTSVENMQVAYLYNFGENIEWKNEDNLSQFHIHYIGTNKEIIQILDFVAKQRKIKNKPIKYTHNNSFRSIPSAQLIFVDKAYNNHIKSIQEACEGKHILIVTDEYDDKKSVMINFFMNNKKQIQFEINKPNLIIEGLRAGPNLMLHGGTEIDIAEIYKQNKLKYEAAIDSLQSEKSKVESFRKEINHLKIELEDQVNQMRIKQSEITALSTNLKSLQDSLSISQFNLDLKKDQLKNLQTEVREKQQTLNNATELAKNKEIKAKLLEKEITEKLELLNEYNKQINKQKATIESKELELSDSNNTIALQRIGLVIACLIAVVILSLSIQLVRANKNKNKAFVLLNEQNKQLEKALSDLKETQSQLIQSEKMASLGQLTAGIAHEINTPLGAINSSAQNIIDNYETLSKEFVELTRNVDASTFKLFLEILETPTDVERTSKESRAKRKEVKAILEEWGCSSADATARQLADIRILDNIEKHKKIIIHENSSKLLANAYNIRQLLFNSLNIRNAVDKASKVVFALKKYSHKEQNDVAHKLDLKDSIETVLTIYKNNLKNFEVTRHFPPLSKNLYAFGDELSQVWTNIIYNGIQAMNYKGTLDIGYTESNDKVLIHFKDNGPGIPEEIREKIFEPFFTTKSRGEGTGLGLDIVKSIVEKHGGTIFFETETGVGTTFFIELPLA